MTMVPSQSSKQNSEYVFYSNTTTTSTAMNQVQLVEGLYNNNCFGSEFVLRHMADHEDEDYSSSSRRPNTHHNEPEHEPEPEPVSTSKQEEQEEEEGEGANNNNNNWLQLSIGFHQTAVTTTTKNDDRDHHHEAPSSGSGLLELELLPTNWASSRPNLEPPPVVAAGRGCSSNFGATNSLVFDQTTSFSSSSYSSMSMSMPSGPSPIFGGQQLQQQQQILPLQWAFGPLLPHSMPTMPSSTSFITTTSYSSSHSSSSLRPPLGSYNYPHHHQYHAPFHFPSPSPSSSSGFDQIDVAGPSSHVTVRVVDPPRRPHSGIWFMLQASQNQAKEPYLPQIPKNYLRIKDGRMTVRLLLKYLVSKLKLDSESEIEITCRGQQLLPFLTLQHVRDNIWTPRDTTSTRALLSDSSTTDHVMVLHYGRSTS